MDKPTIRISLTSNYNGLVISTNFEMCGGIPAPNELNVCTKESQEWIDSLPVAYKEMFSAFSDREGVEFIQPRRYSISLELGLLFKIKENDLQKIVNIVIFFYNHASTTSQEVLKENFLVTFLDKDGPMAISGYCYDIPPSMISDPPQ